jgi:DNA-binding transcriptional regulator YdaS (Cro superfamily)
MEIYQGELIKKRLSITTIIAERVGVSRAYVRQIMTGARRVRSEKSRAVVAEINRIAKLLELSEI